ncbi:MAG: restriction endonuclease subunit S [Acidobacteriota bacterium]|nr:restriction endonuclease subunit S [Acidobacteriota bacterium]
MIDEKQVAVASASAPGVPDGWRVVRFGGVVRNVDVSERQPLERGLERFVGLEHLDPESLHIKRWGLIEEGTSFTRKFVRGQVLFGKRRAYQRKAAVAEFDGICSGDILVFEPKGDELLPELLPFIVQSDGFFEHALGTSAGSLLPRTKWSDLARYEFALPPKDEQRRIADILWAAESVIERTSVVVDSVSELTSAFRSELLRNNIFQKVKVGQVSKFTSGKAIRVTGLPSYTSETPVPVYGGNGLAGYTESALQNIASRVVIVGRVGQYCGVVLLSDAPCWITDNALFSVSVSPDIDVDFLGLCLEAIGLNKQKIGNYLPLINQSVIHNAIIPLPNIKTQKRYNQKARIIQEAQQSAIKNLEEARNLLKELKNKSLR